MTEAVTMEVLAGARSDARAEQLRRLLNCVIASVAWRCGTELLAQDGDLVRVARVVGTRLDPATPRARATS